MRHIKKQEAFSHSKEKNKTTGTVSEKELMVDLLDKDFLKTVSKMLKELKKSKNNV